MQTHDVAPGHYSTKQLECSSKAVAFSHQARFRTAVALAGVDRQSTLLDYGAGDGTFLAMVSDSFKSCVGADIATEQVDDCRARFVRIANVTFCHTSDLRSGGHDGAYDVVTCMEVLEHCVERDVDHVLGELRRLVSPSGRVIISVPIETGPSFLLKLAVRRVAGWRGLSDYAQYERYSPAAAARMLFAGSGSVVPRPVYGDPGAEYHSHYGFNWRVIRGRVNEMLRVERTIYSPFNAPLGCVDSQAWMICRPR